MKIFCIGRNYINHAKELNNDIPTEPMVFMKPPTAILRENKDFYYPSFSKKIHFEVELVIKIKKNGRHIQPQFAKDYYDEIGLGIDFTARDIQDELKGKGHPWEKAKAFDNSAVISEFIPMEKAMNEEGHFIFSLFKNGKRVQLGNSADLIFDFDTLIVHLSQYFTFQTGDLIFTGTPEGVGPIEIGDHLEGFVGDQRMFECKIK